MEHPCMTNVTKPVLYLTGSGDGPPTAEDILALYTAITGKEPTLEEAACMRAAILALNAKTTAGRTVR
jgi:hypothetical protein